MSCKYVHTLSRLEQVPLFNHTMHLLPDHHIPTRERNAYGGTYPHSDQIDTPDSTGATSNSSHTPSEESGVSYPTGVPITASQQAGRWNRYRDSPKDGQDSSPPTLGWQQQGYGLAWSSSPAASSEDLSGIDLSALSVRARIPQSRFLHPLSTLSFGTQDPPPKGTIHYACPNADCGSTFSRRFDLRSTS
jgi:hypothetical protein